MDQINSGKLNVILQHILFSVMLYMIKHQYVIALSDLPDAQSNEITKESAQEIAACCEQLLDKYPRLSHEDISKITKLINLLPQRISHQKVHQSINAYAQTHQFFKEIMREQPIKKTKLFKILKSQLKDHLVSTPSVPHLLNRNDFLVHIATFWSAIYFDKKA